MDKLTDLIKDAKNIILYMANQAKYSIKYQQVINCVLFAYSKTCK